MHRLTITDVKLVFGERAPAGAQSKGRGTGGKSGAA
jgi:hypothetical protein